MDSRPPDAGNAATTEARNRPGRMALRIALFNVALVGVMNAALRWTPTMQPPLIHIAILFVGLPIGGVLSLAGVVLSFAGLGRRPRTAALFGLVLSLVGLVGLALVIYWFGLFGVWFEEKGDIPVEETGHS